MAAGDLSPFTSEHGGHNIILEFAVVAVPTYNFGEWVDVVAGAIDEFAGAAVGANFVKDVNYISAEDATANIARFGDARYVNPPNITRRDSVYALDDNTEFVTRNAFNGSDALEVPTLANWVPGATCGMHITAVPASPAALHGVDRGDTGLLIRRVLDARGRDLGTPGAGAGVFVTFTVDIS